MCKCCSPRRRRPPLQPRTSPARQPHAHHHLRLQHRRPIDGIRPPLHQSVRRGRTVTSPCASTERLWRLHSPCPWTAKAWLPRSPCVEELAQTYPLANLLVLRLLSDGADLPSESLISLSSTSPPCPLSGLLSSELSNTRRAAFPAFPPIHVTCDVSFLI